jgi:hypothetical protein
MGLIVDIPLFTAIAVVKSPYMLFKGWFRLVHDLITREGPFLETACIPIAGLTILLWPIVVTASILLAVFSSIFVGLYASIIVYQVCLYFSIYFPFYSNLGLLLLLNLPSNFLVGIGKIFPERCSLCDCNGC